MAHELLQNSYSVLFPLGMVFYICVCDIDCAFVKVFFARCVSFFCEKRMKVLSRLKLTVCLYAILRSSTLTALIIA